jgi:hypothetical protein
MRKHMSISLLAMSVLMAGLVGCGQGGSPGGQPATPAATIVSQSPSTAPTLVLGPSGYGALKLGMTRAEAVATGLTTGTEASGKGTCGGQGDGLLKGAPAPAGPANTAGQLFFSEAWNLVAIYAFPGVKTPEGIGLGSTYEQMRAAYPDWNPVPAADSATDGRGGVKVPGNGDAHYRIVVNGAKVVELSLDANNQDCYE